ncbi:hypothetical protein Tco_0921542 [Tanacetum coccineum]
MPTDPHHTPIITQPSSSQPQRKQKSRRPKEKDTEIPQSSVPSDPTNVADEAVNEEPSMQLKELMDFCTKLQQRVLDLENTKTAQAQEITSLKKRVKKLEKKGGSRTHKLKRLYRVGRSARVVSSKEESLGDQEDASKQGRIDDIDADKDIYLVNVHRDEDMFGVNDLEGDEVVVESEVADKDVNLSVDEVTLAQALAALKSVKVQEKGDVIKEPSVLVGAASTKVSTVIPTTAATIITTVSSRPRAKGIVFHEQDQAPTLIRVPRKLKQRQHKKVAQREQEKLWNKKALRSKRWMMIKKTEKLKQCMKIIPDDGDDVTIEATPLSTKSITIVDYKIYKEGKKSYFQIIRADGNFQMYLTFRKMLKNFDREDLEVLWSIVKARFKKTEPVNYIDIFLHINLKTMFENHLENSVWKNQQGLVKVLN